MRNRLGVRLALLIIVVGPLVFFAFMNIVYVANRLLGESQLQDIFWITIATITTPLAIGMIAAWYVNRRLRKFAESILILRANKHTTAIPASGIREFDEVAHEFNQLTMTLGKEEELRKNLISDTSHELNTPLAAMLSQIAGMQDNILDVTPKRLQILREQTERLIDMVSRLDDYTAARLPVKNPEPISLYQIGSTMHEQFQPLLGTAKIQLDITVKPEYRLMADKAALEQILANIIRNAIKYSKASRIIIEPTEDGFAISDNGIGVTPEDRRHLFERFYRVEKSRNRQTGGLGLGLAIVQELASQQGWKVYAEDAGPGLRIKFVIR